MPATAQGQLPAEFADDPVAKALGPAVINAALKEGTVNLYSGTTTRDFLQNGGQAKFEKRFGIKIKPLTSELRKLVDRIRTEISVGRVVADIFEGNDQYMLELHRLDALAKWKPPAPELDRINKEVIRGRTGRFLVADARERAGAGGQPQPGRSEGDQFLLGRHQSEVQRQGGNPRPAFVGRRCLAHARHPEHAGAGRRTTS